MNSIKINLSILSHKDPPAEHLPAAPRPTLKQKIEYAIECIEYDYCKSMAIDFLRKANDLLLKLPQIKTEHQVLIDMIKPALMDYGDYHLGGDKNPGKEE